MSGSLAEEIRKQAIQELDKIADDGVRLMKEFCPQGGKPWSTGALKASIRKEKTGEYSRFIGTDIRAENGFPYAEAVDQGRRGVSPKNYFFPGEDQPRLYLKGYDVWLRPGKSVDPAKAQHFVERTIEALENRY